MLGTSLPNWLVNPGTVLLRRHVRHKNDPLCDEVDLIDANHSFVRVRFQMDMSLQSRLTIWLAVPSRLPQNRGCL